MQESEHSVFHESAASASASHKNPSAKIQKKCCTSVWVQKLLGKELKSSVNSDSLQDDLNKIHSRKISYLGCKFDRNCFEYIGFSKIMTILIQILSTGWKNGWQTFHSTAVLHILSHQQTKPHWPKWKLFKYVKLQWTTSGVTSWSSAVRQQFVILLLFWSLTVTCGKIWKMVDFDIKLDAQEMKTSTRLWKFLKMFSIRKWLQTGRQWQN